MYEKILYATDFSDMAKKTLHYVRGLRGSGAREVIILHVVDKGASYHVQPSQAIDFLAVEKGWRSWP
jgi:nucleotide-binding universal stress UspA family protein